MIRPSIDWPLLLLLRIRFGLGTRWTLTGFSSDGWRCYDAEFTHTERFSPVLIRTFERDWWKLWSRWKETT